MVDCVKKYDEQHRHHHLLLHRVASLADVEPKSSDDTVEVMGGSPIPDTQHDSSSPMSLAAQNRVLQFQISDKKIIRRVPKPES